MFTKIGKVVGHYDCLVLSGPQAKDAPDHYIPKRQISPIPVPVTRHGQRKRKQEISQILTSIPYKRQLLLTPKAKNTNSRLKKNNNLKLSKTKYQ